MVQTCNSENYFLLQKLTLLYFTIYIYTPSNREIQVLCVNPRRPPIRSKPSIYHETLMLYLKKTNWQPNHANVQSLRLSVSLA